MQLVVAAQPGSAMTVAPEIELVKAALLYGDRVTLLSPITTMLLDVAALERFSPLQQIDLVRRVAPYLPNGAELAASEAGLDQLEDFLRRSARIASPSDRLLRVGLTRQLAPVKQILADAVGGIERESGIDQLAQARAKGYLKIESANPDDAVDLLADCIIKASSAAKGINSDDSQLGRLVATFVAKLSAHLSSGEGYLIFDKQVASLTEAAIREGLFKPAPGPAGRSAQAMSAAAFMARLPTFPGATVDEVLDIRESSQRLSYSSEVRWCRSQMLSSVRRGRRRSPMRFKTRGSVLSPRQSRTSTRAFVKTGRSLRKLRGWLGLRTLVCRVWGWWPPESRPMMLRLPWLGALFRLAHRSSKRSVTIGALREISGCSRSISSTASSALLLDEC
ncbi:MAG: hypothetical protein WB698_00155 [Solirubrobacteraceae bacterium]